MEDEDTNGQEKKSAPVRSGEEQADELTGETTNGVDLTADEYKSSGPNVAALQSEIAELKRQHLYLLADFDNFRKQAIKERSDLMKFGSEPIIREILNVLDNLLRAAATPLTADTLETYKNGIDLIVMQFKKVLERFGVEEVDPSGQPFDPTIHEAVGADSNPDLPANAVTQVLKKAYKLRGKVIRPAQVLVNGTPTAEEG